MHHNINISATGSTHLKSGPTLKEKLTGGVNSIPFWQEGLSCKLWKGAQYTHKTYKTKQHWKTANMHHNISMFTTGNTHLNYRKHSVHSAAHKLKIRSSRLVLTTAGTDLDSTDSSYVGELKICLSQWAAKAPNFKPVEQPWCRERHIHTQKKTPANCTRQLRQTRLHHTQVGSLVRWLSPTELPVWENYKEKWVIKKPTLELPAFLSERRMKKIGWLKKINLTPSHASQKRR